MKVKAQPPPSDGKRKTPKQLGSSHQLPAQQNHRKAQRSWKPPGRTATEPLPRRKDFIPLSPPSRISTLRLSAPHPTHTRPQSSSRKTPRPVASSLQRAGPGPAEAQRCHRPTAPASPHAPGAKGRRRHPPPSPRPAGAAGEGSRAQGHRPHGSPGLTGETGPAPGPRNPLPPPAAPPGPHLAAAAPRTGGPVRPRTGSGGNPTPRPARSAHKRSAPAPHPFYGELAPNRLLGAGLVAPRGRGPPLASQRASDVTASPCGVTTASSDVTAGIHDVTELHACPRGVPAPTGRSAGFRQG